MGKNRLELRRQAEAAEKQETTKAKSGARKTKKRKAAKRKSTSRKSKDHALQRKRMVWCVFNGSMKEEGRFPYDQKEAAEAKLEQLRSKSKKLYFLQPVKEVMGDAPPPSEDSEDKEPKKKASKKPVGPGISEDELLEDSDDLPEEEDEE